MTDQGPVKKPGGSQSSATSKNDDDGQTDDVNKDGSKDWIAAYPGIYDITGKRELLWKLSPAVANQKLGASEPYLKDDAHYLRIDDGDFNEYYKKPNPKATSMYISTDLWEKLQPNDDFRKNTNPLPTRDKDGRIQMIERPPPPGPNRQRADNRKWQEIFFGCFPNVTTAKQGFMRAIDPKIPLIYKLESKTHYTKEEFEDAVASLDGKNKQTCTVHQAAGEPAGHVRLSSSPYGDFSVWIKKSIWESYLEARKDRQMPTKITLEQALKLPWPKAAEPAPKPGPATGIPATSTPAPSTPAAARKAKAKQKQLVHRQKVAKQQSRPGSPQGAGSSTSVPAPTPNPPQEISISYFQMANKKPRVEAKGQASVMGVSASKVAAKFDWEKAEVRITDEKGKDGTVWQGRNMPAEWLHKVGYAYGQPEGKTQTPSNLVFGSSETNSLMTRYEISIQEFLKSDSDFRKATSGGKGSAASAERKSKGALTISEIKDKIIKRNPAPDYKSVSTTLAEQLKVLQISAVPEWLWFGLNYRFRLSATEAQTSLWAPVGTFHTDFYPFQRPFVTLSEIQLDSKLRGVLLNKGLAKARPASPSKMQSIKPTAGFVSGPVHARVSHEPRPDPFNFNNLTAVLLSVGGDAPATASTGFTPRFAASTAPQHLNHAQIWSDAISGNPVRAAGVVRERPSLVSVDDQGQLVEITSDSIAAPPEAGLTVRAISTAEAPNDMAHNPTELGAVSPFITMNGIAGFESLNNVSLLAVPAQSAPPGFVLSGDLQLFGNISAKLYTFHGTAAGDQVQELVTIPNNLSLGALFSGLIGEEFKSIGLQNVQFRYFEQTSDSVKPSGMWLEADVEFTGVLEPIGIALGSIFKQNKPTLHVESLISKTRDWTQLELPAGFSIIGSFDGISTKLGEFIEFTKVGLRITVDQQVEDVPTYRKFHTFSYDFFGNAHMNLPGSVTPLDVEFSLSKIDTLINLTMHVEKDLWENVFGINGLNLSEVVFSAQFDDTHLADSLAFDLTAMMQKGEEMISLEGYFSKDDWAFDAEIDYLDLEGISQMFDKVLGGALPEFDHELIMEMMLLHVDSTGISFTGNVIIDDLESLEGSIEVSPQGMNLAGKIGNVQWEDVLIKEASFEVFISPQGKSKRPIQFGIKGVVDFSGVEISSTLYIDKKPGKALVWTVYGEYDATISAGNLASELKGTFLDFPMSHVALIAGNANQPADGFQNKYNYPIVKGISLLAQIKSIDALNQLTRVNMDGLILKVAIVAGAGMEFGIVLPMDKAISFGPNVTSGPISVAIEIAKPPSLMISAGLNVTVAGQNTPLVFKMTLEASLFNASATAQMLGYWENPLGVGKNIKIGPNMALEAGITYATFLTTGTPTKLAISGGLAIGKTEAQVALLLGTNPTEELISASLAHLTLGDLIKFASDVTGESIPVPDESTMFFEQVQMYISTGVSIGAVSYPVGASFSGAMQLFGKKATVSAKIENGIKIAGSFDGFNLGPLAIKGATTPRAQLAMELSVKKQNFLIDGGTFLVGTGASIHLEVQLMPKPVFEFIITTAFTELLPFTIDGKMIGVFSKTEDLDFQLHALLEQKILTYLVSQANLQLVTAQKAAKEGFENTSKQLDQAEASFKQAVAKAQGDLAKAQVAWNAKSAAAQHNIDEVIQSTQAGQKKMQADLGNATAAYEAKVNAAQKSLEQTRANAAAAIQSAQANLAGVTAKVNTGVEAQKKQVAEAKQSMDSKFGDALKSIQGAQDSVQKAQDALNAANQNVAQAQTDLDHASVFGKAAKAASLAAAKTAQVAKQASFATAQGALNAAEAIVNGAGYQAAAGTLKAYQASLDAAVAAAPGLISAAQSTLDATIIAQNAAVATATSALEQTKTASNEATALKAANMALEAYNKTQDALLASAKSAMSALQSSVEFSVFSAAQKSLDFATSNTKDLDIARHALDVAKATEDKALSATKWMVDHAGNFFNIEKVELTGTLKGLCEKAEPMKAHVVGIVGDKRIDTVVDYSIGRTPDLIKGLFEHMWRILTS